MNAATRTAAPSRDEHSRKAGWIPIVLLLAVCYVGYFKGTFLLSWLGFDLTVPLVLLLGTYVLYRQLGRRSGGLRHWAPVIGLWALFLPGAVYGLTSGYSPYKTVYLFTITLISALAAPVVLQTKTDLRRWIKGTIVAGFAIAAVSLIDPDVEYVETFGRLSVDGSSTIGSARVIGAAFVSVVLMACMTQSRHRLTLAVTGMFLGAFLIAIGSRGPLLGSILAIGVALMSARLFRGSRWSSLLAGVSGLGLAVYWAVSTNAAGARRLLGFLTGERVDEARSSLISTAANSIGRNPLGSGWGGFSTLMGDGSGSTHPHNLFLEVFLEGGWIAGIALLIFIVLALRRLWGASGGPVGAVILALAIYWLAVAQTSSDINGNRITLVILACAFVWPRRRRNDARRRIDEYSSYGETPMQTQGDDQIAPGESNGEVAPTANVRRGLPDKRTRRPR